MKNPAEKYIATKTIEAREMDLKEYTNSSECDPNPKGFYIEDIGVWLKEDKFNSLYKKVDTITQL